jgi:alpha 1,3-glucosidase
VLVDPHLRAERGYEVYAEALDRRLFIKNRDGNDDFVGNCWPGRSSWPDFINPEAGEWWEGRFDFSKFTASRSNLHIWNDMNEISVFDSPEGTAPRDLRHFGDLEEREVHNIYGHLMVSATFGGMVRRDGNRPFILTRSFFAGSQRYAAAWSGDNTADWTHLRNSVPLVLTCGLSSMVYTGADVGGFFDSPPPSLLARWYQVGAWLYPFFRCHCHHESAHREIYTLTGEDHDIARDAVVDRYRLLNYWYTLSREANLTGAPIVRPLWWEFDDDRFADTDDVAMLGSALLVAPFLEEGNASLTVDLPNGRWYRWEGLGEVKGRLSVEFNGGRTAVFLRGGTIVPIRRRLRKSSTLLFLDPFVLVVGLGPDLKAQGELYVDDGTSFAFTKGVFVHRRFAFDGKVLSSTVVTPGSLEKYNVVIEQIRIAGLSAPPKAIVDSKGTELRFDWKDQVLTIHRPQLPVGLDFTLTFNF